jgi:hypothetical protein
MGIVSGIDCEVKGLGYVIINVSNAEGNCVSITLKDVLFVPSLEDMSKGAYLRLMSVGRTTQVGCYCNFSRDEYSLVLPPGPSIRLVRSRGLTWLPNFVNPSSALPAASTVSRDLIYRRCGHLHEDGLLKLDKLGVDGVWGFSLLPPPLSFCAEYAIGKSKVFNIDRSSTRDKDPPNPFHTVALDIWGPMSTEDIGGDKWFLGGVCYKTSLIFGNVMKHKSDATATWKSMISRVKSYGYKISRLRIDNDTVLISKEFTLVCETEAIAVERTVPYSHWQLGRIERQWRTLID